MITDKVSTHLLNCCDSSGLDAESELLSFSSVFLFSGERTGDGRLRPATGSFRVRSSLCSVELAP